MLNPNLIDFDVVSSTHTGCVTGTARTTVNNILLPNDHFFYQCYQLSVLSVKWNEKQQDPISFMMRYTRKCQPAITYSKLTM